MFSVPLGLLITPGPCTHNPSGPLNTLGATVGSLERRVRVGNHTLPFLLPGGSGGFLDLGLAGVQRACHRAGGVLDGYVTPACHETGRLGGCLQVGRSGELCRA